MGLGGQGLGRARFAPAGSGLAFGHFVLRLGFRVTCAD
jgi:hypothetical protein